MQKTSGAVKDGILTISTPSSSMQFNLSDEYLEPTPLGYALGVSGTGFGKGITMNKVLVVLGLQNRFFAGDETGWEPTDDAIETSTAKYNKWTVQDRTGYNLKWNVEKVRTLIIEKAKGV